MSEETAIQFDHVSFGFTPETLVFEEVSLDLARGGFYLVSGPSGVGKSTLLRLINRLEEPTAGEIRFGGNPLPSYDPPRLRRSILSIQQTPVAIDATVRANLLLPFRFAANGDVRPPDDAALTERLAEVRLQDVSLDTHAHTLSVGQLQRLCFVRGLLLSPEVMLLDEPTSALDEESRDVVLALIGRLHAERQLTSVMVCHGDLCPRDVSPVLLTVRDRRIQVKAP